MTGIVEKVIQKPTRRIKLEIFPENNEDIRFVLWNLKQTENASIASANRKGVLKKFDTNNSILENLSNSWKDEICKAEEDFKKEREKIDEFHKKALKDNGTKDEEINDKLFFNENWIKAVCLEEKKFMEIIGKIIYRYSLQFQQELLPEPEPDDDKKSDFWEKFEEYIDKPSQSTNDPATLLQIQTTKELSIIPWWLCRTQDEETLWCCRYAIGFAPFLNQICPPQIKFNDLRIISITRPTLDTYYRLPITAATFESAEDLYKNNALKWEMLDGIHRESNPGKKIPEKENNTVLNRYSFQGVSKTQITSAKRIRSELRYSALHLRILFSSSRC